MSVPSPTFGVLLDNLASAVSTLVRQEMDLVRAEWTANFRVLAKGAAAVLAGVLLAATGLLTLGATLILVLVRLGMPAWAAAGLVTLVLIGSGAVAVKIGLTWLGGVSLVPKEAVASLKEDVQWLKSQFAR